MASNVTFNQATRGTEVAKTYGDRCAGKIALVTGVTIGNIGDATARALAHGGASTVIITGRDDQKLSDVHKELSRDYPKTNFRPLKLNLSSLADVKKSAEEIINDSAIPHIDILVANAGRNSFSNERTETVDGIETHFGVNHLSHFLFVNTLLPKVRAAAKKNAPGETRIVTVSSGAVAASPIRFSDWNYEGKPVPDEEKPNWAPMAQMFGLSAEPGPFEYNIAYGQSKTANVLHALQLNKLLNSECIYSFSLHPGFVGSTGAEKFLPNIPKNMVEFFGFKKSIDQGCATSVVAALDPGLKPESGVYLDDCQVALEKCPEWAKSPEAAEKLWKLSEEIVASKLGGAETLRPKSSSQ